MKQAALALIVIFSFAAVFYYFAGLVEPQKIIEAQIPHYEPQYAQEQNILQMIQSPSPAECKNDESRTCKTDNGCLGNQICEGGRWSPCQTVRICRPARVAQCPYDSCSFGLRMCNACGDGWSACELPE